MTTDKLDSLLRSFADAIREVVRAELIEGLSDSLKAPAPKGKRQAPPPSGKRSPERLKAIKQRLVSAIKANPGTRAEELAKVVKLSTAELALPLRQLVADKIVKVDGVARGSRYTMR